MSILGHFDSSIEKRGEAWVNHVYSDTDSHRNMAAVADVWKGEMVFFFPLSLCRAKVHGFTLTASAQLHKSSHVKNKKTGKKGERWMRGKGSRKKTLDDVNHFTVTKKIQLAGKNTPTWRIFFLKMPTWWATATKIKMAKGWGKPKLCEVSMAAQKSLCFCCQNRMMQSAGYQILCVCG